MREAIIEHNYSSDEVRKNQTIYKTACISPLGHGAHPSIVLWDGKNQFHYMTKEATLKNAKCQTKEEKCSAKH